MAKSTSKIKLRGSGSIGSPAAETDHAYLKECFVNLPLIDALKDVNSPRSFLLGRTGAGKSAVLWHLEQTLKNVSRIDPKEASFEYVGNSSIIRHVTDMGVDLHVFYQYLWKHILTLHIIRECLDVRTANNFEAMVEKIRGLVRRDTRKAAVVKYLEEHDNRFWLDAEAVSREITNTLTEKLGAEVGLSAAAFTSKIESGAAWKEEEKRTFKYRAQEIVSGLQMRELGETINALAELMDETKRDFYVLIDDLDSKWGGEEDTHYALIRALIECIKSFRRIPNLKIVVAVREDLYEAMLRATKDRLFQAEKLEGLISRLRWSRELLHRVVEGRIDRLFRQEYTKQGVRLEHVLPASIREDSIRAYLIDHTLRRPRDVIAFVNEILSANEGSALPLPARAVAAVEPTYSNARVRALADEWRSCHPLVDIYLRVLARSDGPMGLGELDEKRLYELVCEVEALDRKPYDEVERLAKQAYERNKEDRFKRLARALISCLFKMGAIGVKVRSEQGYIFCYEQQTTLQDAEIGDQTKIVIHPMLLSALGGRPEQSAAA